MNQGFFRRFFSFRILAIAALYALIITSAYLLAFTTRFDFSIQKSLEETDRFDFYISLVFIVLLKLVFLAAFGQFRSLLRFFHMPDLVKIFFSISIAESIILLLTVFNLLQNSKGVIAMDYILSLVGICGFRILFRIYNERNLSSDRRKSSARIAIVGAGDTGCSLAADLLAKRRLGISPVLFLDDDKSKQGKLIMGINVFEIPSDFRILKRLYSIDKLIIAMPSAPRHKIGEIAKNARKANLGVNIVPSPDEMASGRVTMSKVRNVEIEDILGRKPVELESEALSDMIRGKVVLVTGAGGSIGSELCRQIAAKSPSLLVLLEQCEVQMFQVEQEIISMELGVNIRCAIADVTDEERMREVFAKYSPEIVFHAAAHKHVPMMESQPGEALKNNTLGTWITANCASEAKVKKFVLISTDKAVNPTNVMGATKRLAEMCVRAMQTKAGNATAFAAVRFGNVLGSSGSVIPTFKKQIEKGGPVTVTHPEITRFFMTIPEAVGLVLQCGALADGGEIFVLDMGSPMKIIDIARQMISLSGFEPNVDIEIKITGLRPGEKLFEEIMHKSEHLTKTKHPRIFGFEAPNPSYGEVLGIISDIKKYANHSDSNSLKRLILKYVPEYKPQFND